VWWLFFSVFSPISDVRVASTTDQGTLAQMAAKYHSGDPGDSYYIPRAAFAKLTADGVANAATKTTDSQQRAWLLAVSKLVFAIKDIPDDHRYRIFAALVPLADTYNEHLWVSKYGLLDEISIQWRQTSHVYYFRDVVAGGTLPGGSPVQGEDVVFRAAFKAADGSHVVTAHWSSDWPGSISVGGPSHYLTEGVVILKQSGKYNEFVPSGIDYHDAYLPHWWLKGDQPTSAIGPPLGSSR